MAKKRANGEGTIGRHKTGCWVARLVVDGKRRCYYGATRREVEEKLTRAKRDRDLGLSVADEALTVGQYLRHWLDNDAKQTVKPNTWRGYEQHVRLYLVPLLGHIRLAQLSPRHVQRLHGDLLANGMTPATLHNVRATLRRALTRATQLGLVQRNAASLVDAPTVPRPSMTTLTPDLARAILAAFRGHDLEPAVTVALLTGLRQGEQLGLKWSDVDLEAGTLRVQRSLQRVEGKLQLLEPKTPASRRTVHLPREAVATLRSHRAEQARMRIRLGPEWQDTGHVFTTATGGPLDGTVVTHRFHRQLASHGLPRIRWHDLRHGCATLLLSLGVSPKVIQEQLGHSGISVTMDTYAHVLPAGMREAADRLGDLLANHEGCS